MAAIVKRGYQWYYRFTDANGRRVMRKGCPDRRATEGLAAQAEAEVARIRAGRSDPRVEAYAVHESKTLDVHLADRVKSLAAKGSTRKLVKLFSDRAARVVAVLRGA